MRRNLFQKYFSLILIILLIGVNITCVVGNIKILCSNSLYTPHDPIFIEGNNDFSYENGVSGGSGTQSSPYLIKDWEINASSQSGILIKNTDVFFVIDNCYIHSGSKDKSGIIFKNVTNGRIQNSIIEDNKYGIIFENGYPERENSSYNRIKNNTIKDNAKDGIHFEHTGEGWHSHNVIYLNEISDNKQGIFMVMSDSNLIYSNNIICNTKWGVSLVKCIGGGDSNRVYHNNFIKNGDESSQGHEQWTIDNYWDDGYPSGGNFWSDYEGVDNFSGLDQDIPGSDDIGDTPYEIFLVWEEYFIGGFEPVEYDNYPLMEPWGDNLHPFAEFTWTPNLPDPGEEILFNASESADYDGEIILYEWDWNNDGEFDENSTSETAVHTFEEMGFYPVTLRVIDNSSTDDTDTKTVRIGNQPPYEPSDPAPADGATDINLVTTLNWTCADPEGDSLTFDVYFGTTASPTKVASNVTQGYNPGELDLNTTYYWKIVARDEYNASTAGPVWSFKARENLPPYAPEIEGEINGKFGVDYEYNFSLMDPDGDAMYLRIDWGSGTPGPWNGPYNSNTTVILNHTWDEKGTYIIKAQAKDEYGLESEWGTLEVTMPKNKVLNNMFLQSLMKRFSNSFPVLRYVFRVLSV